MKGTAAFCDSRVAGNSIFAVLHRECHVLFGDELFSDLFASTGRRSVPPRVVAVVMVLQRLFGLSDREAVEAFEFDTRWKYAAGGLDFDYPGFAHTVLVDMRARLARSERPRRIFEVTLDAARTAGLVGAKRVLDSTPLYDAVATMDTVTLIRSAIRALLAIADPELTVVLRAVLCRDDDYASGGKPTCDWDDAVSREALIDELARDAYACLGVLDGRTLEPEVKQASELLATVVGQDLEVTDDGTFRIARKVAKDRVISTVDPEARHGHKTAARSFDGFKGHIAEDPDSEIITNTVVTAGNAGDASVAEDLIEDLLPKKNVATDAGDTTYACDGTDSGDTTGGADATDAGGGINGGAAREADAGATEHEPAGDGVANAETRVYGDNAYGTGAFQSRLEDEGIASGCKTQPPVAPGGLFAKDRFVIDLKAGTVTCPNDVTVEIRFREDRSGTAHFGDACATCPLRAACTNAAGGRTVGISVNEEILVRSRERQRDPEWKADYRATRPKVERKLGHLMRRKHGGRRARVRGTTKIDADFNLLAAAVNLARLAVLGLHSTPTGWAASA